MGGVTPILMNLAGFRRSLLTWYAQHQRDLPWRRTKDPWAILVSEIMLQQTRVEAVIPYFERFLARYPSALSFAGAPEQEVLRAWAGLGYYSRARNLQKAAMRITESGSFPQSYAAVIELPGVGAYTAAAVVSIAFDEPHAALDGNVARVLARVGNYDGDIKSGAAKVHLQAIADRLIDSKRPGDFNQAMMELGATLCVPRDPKCLLCPVGLYCEARAQGTERELPVRGGPPQKTVIEKSLLLIRRQGEVLVWQRPATSVRMAGFWELPEPDEVAGARVGAALAKFSHTIVNNKFHFTVHAATLNQKPAKGLQWFALDRLHEIPLSTTAKKAVLCSIDKRSYQTNVGEPAKHKRPARKRATPGAINRDES